MRHSQTRETKVMSEQQKRCNSCGHPIKQHGDGYCECYFWSLNRPVKSEDKRESA